MHLGTQNESGTISQCNIEGWLAMATTRSLLSDLTAEELRAVLRYEPDTGIFYWVVGGRWNRLAGKIAGTKRIDGYVRININHRSYWAHRLAWLYMTGHWPPAEIDHIDEDPSNNQWTNLRLATSGQNKGNKRAQANSGTGIRGVHFYKARNQWVPYVMGKNGKLKRLGYYDSLEEAVRVRRHAAKERFGDFFKE